MAEYIERKVALAAIRERCAPCGEGIEALKASPAADVAPVVRCENCTSGIMSDDNKYIICCRLGVGMELDGFCSHGERKIT